MQTWRRIHPEAADDHADEEHPLNNGNKSGAKVSYWFLFAFVAGALQINQSTSKEKL